jgi:diguanylate cyclase (GGDEF)-like protein/PAS domain S-box-containing protein
MNLRLSVLITLLLVLSALLGSGLLFMYEAAASRAAITRAGSDDINRVLTHLQNMLNTQLTSGNLQDAKLSLSVSALHPGINSLLLANDRDQVILANRYIWQGESAVGVARYDPALARQVREQHASRIEILDDGRLLHGYYPITLSFRTGQGAEQNGALFVEFDLAQPLAQARHSAMVESASLAGSMLAITLIIALLLHHLVSRRVTRLVEASRRLAEGDLAARVGMRGHDELARLGQAFDHMAEQRMAVEDTLRDSEERFRFILESSPVAVRITVDQGRRIVFANPRYRELLGSHEQEGALPNPTSFYAHPADYEDISARLQRGECITNRLIETRHPDGRSCWSLASYLPLEYAGEPAVLGWFYDISERKRAEEALQLAASVYENSSEAMEVVDADNRIVDINPAFSQMTGYSREEAIGQRANILRSGHHDGDFYQDMWQALHQTGRWQGEIWDRRKDGELFPVWLTINTLYDAADQVYRRIALFSDISKRKQSEELIWKQANFDALTELPNRRMFRERLEHETRQILRSGRKLALLLIDLDRFKEINDTLGHHEGDVLLIEAARRISECVRESDTVARLGGDEFTVIVSPLTGTEPVDMIAEKILNRLAQPFLLGDEMNKEQAYVSASLGITFFPDDTGEVEQLLKNADQAMYAAKNAGRNRYSYFTLALQEHAQSRLRLINDLRGALAAGQFSLHFQPIVELASSQVVKAEALLRWQHPTRGWVSPAQFIPLAEETGLINAIGDWVFREAARHMQRWRALAPADFKISVNVSPVQFQTGGALLDAWTEYLRQLDLPGSSLVLEITEGLLLNAQAVVTDRLLAFRDHGLQVAIDDFGTGYSALSYLKKFDIDYLKIDQAFVRNLETSHNDRVLVEAIIVMAHRLGLQVIAEGVEHASQHDYLRSVDCDYAQGYLFAIPMPASELEKLLQAAPAES